MRIDPAKPALVAVEHSILVATSHMLDRDQPYHDLGADYFARRNDPARRARRLISQLETLGYTITAKPPTTTQRAHEPAWSRRFLFSV